MKATNGQQGDGKHVSYPIFDNDAAYRANSVAKLRGLTQAAIDATGRTVGSAYRSLNLAKHVEALMNKSRPQGLPTPIKVPDLFVKPSDKMFPLGPGAELFVYAPETEPILSMEFRFDIAFGEADVVNGEPLLETLGKMIAVVAVLVDGFKPLL